MAEERRRMGTGKVRGERLLKEITSCMHDFLMMVLADRQKQVEARMEQQV